MIDTENGTVEQQAPPLLPENTIKPEHSKKPATRLIKTVTFSDPLEADYIIEVVEARIKAGITKDWSHFLRQVIDYSINADAVIKSKGLKNPLLFAIPGQTKATPVKIKNGFFNE